jgi:hypothetical protein
MICIIVREWLPVINVGLDVPCVLNFHTHPQPPVETVMCARCDFLEREQGG